MTMRRSAIQEIENLSTVIIILNKRKAVQEWRAAHPDNTFNYYIVRKRTYNVRPLVQIPAGG
ncbi:hypothetical protein EL003_16125 [Salmonella enterica subsp. salamae serovar 42:r:-]|nr:hypothetical protein EL003_16125 [Salmonella enterica subsp. salamae serovar 42:r:-]